MEKSVTVSVGHYDKLNDNKPQLTRSETTQSLVKNVVYGYSVAVAVLFVAGENAGAALLALPYALKEAGWTGIALIILLGANAAYAGVILAKCWLLVEERWPEFKENCRYPYPAIGMMAYGKRMRILVSFCMQFTLVGSCVVVLLLCAQIIHDLTASHVDVCFCLWIIILAAILCPLLFFGTPHDFWPAAALALGTTSIAVFVILYEMFIDYKAENKQEIHYPKPSFSSFFLAIGTVMFAYGATASFPTFQNDMRERRKFPIAVVIAFMILLSIYVPIASIGYKTYGDSVTENVIFTLRDGPNKIVVEILMAGHLFFAFLLLANAPIQEIENWLKIPNGFSLKRVATRVSVLILIVFMGETVPSFGKILNLIGGSAIALLSFILPPLLYLKLCSMKSADWPFRSISIFEKIWLFQIIVVGVIGGIACTFSALVEILSPDAFTPPCYIKPNCTFV